MARLAELGKIVAKLGGTGTVAGHALTIGSLAAYLRDGFGIEKLVFERR